MTSRAQALAGRVDDDHIGGESPGLELQGGLTGVAAEELGVCDAVSAGVVPGASATAWGSSSTPMTLPAARAMARVMVPTPQYRSRTVSVAWISAP